MSEPERHGRRKGRYRPKLPVRPPTGREAGHVIWVTEAARNFWTALLRATGSNKRATEWLLVRYGLDQLQYADHAAALRNAEELNYGPVMPCPMCHRLTASPNLVADFDARSETNPLGVTGCIVCKPNGYRPFQPRNSRVQARRLVPIKLYIDADTWRVLRRLGARSVHAAMRDLLAYAIHATGGKVDLSDSGGLRETIELPMEYPAALPRWME